MTFEFRDAADTTTPRQAVLARVGDAEYALQQMHAANEEYAATGPVQFEARGNTRDGEQVIELVAHIAAQPPEQIARHARTFVAEARASLDNLVWQLSKDAGATSAQLGRAAMPVVGEAGNWPDLRRKKLGALDDEIAERIRLIQPFAAPDRPAEHPLAFLGRASNTDKHRRAITLGLRPEFPPGRSDLLSVSMEMNSHDEAHILSRKLGDKSFADATIYVRQGLISDGDVLVRESALPSTHGGVAATFQKPRIVLGARVGDEGVDGSIFGRFEAVLKFVRGSVEWITGGDRVPDPWENLVGPEDQEPDAVREV